MTIRKPPIDLSRLPPPDLVETLDYETLLADRKADLLARYPDAADTLALASSPLTKLLEESAYREVVLRQRVNDAAKSMLMAYATAADLDQIGVSYYATERQPGESDGAYRRRLLLAYDSWSTAGSEKSYVYHALEASPDISDATAINQHAGVVLITVLSGEGDGTASATLLSAVDAALNAERVRPLTDQVTVQSAAVTTYQVRADLTLREGPSPSVVAPEAQAAAEEYTRTRHRLGKDVVLGAIEAALYVEGVERVTLLEPTADIDCDPTQAAYCTAVEVTIHV